MNKDREPNPPKYLTLVQLHTTTDETECYVAIHPELPNCLGQGDTPEEAEQDLAEATALALEHLAEHGLPIPEPCYLAGDKPFFVPVQDGTANPCA